jgi:hypothetical protein
MSVVKLGGCDDRACCKTHDATGTKFKQTVPY